MSGKQSVSHAPGGEWKVPYSEDTCRAVGPATYTFSSVSWHPTYDVPSSRVCLSRGRVILYKFWTPQQIADVKIWLGASISWTPNPTEDWSSLSDCLLHSRKSAECGCLSRWLLCSPPREPQGGMLPRSSWHLHSGLCWPWRA